MREQFPGYYRPTSKEFDFLWRHGELVFDTNVLLNLYRYGEGARRSWLEVMRRAESRLWIPFQVASEFQRNRVGVISDQRRRYADVRKLAESIRSQMETVFNGLSKHPTLDTRKMTKILEASLKKLDAYVDEVERNHTEFTTVEELVATDAIRAAVDKLYKGKIGPPDTTEKAASRQQDAVARLEDEIPPGYRDVRKKGDVETATGDAILWLQLLDRAAEVKKPILLVTDERGEDWWWIDKGRTLGPRPELVAEMRERAEVSFYLYSPDEFLRRATTIFSANVDDIEAAAEETKQVSEWVRARRDLETVEIIEHRLHRMGQRIAEAENDEERLATVIEELEDTIRRYSNIPDDLANSKLGEKADRRRRSAEREREGLVDEISAVRNRRELMRREFEELRRQYRHVRSLDPARSTSRDAGSHKRRTGGGSDPV